MFKDQISWLKERYTIVSLSHMVSSFASRPTEQHPLASLTFDDGYRNFLDFALPVLRDLRCPVTVFVPSGKVGHYNDWDEGMSRFQKMAIMSYQQLRELPEGTVEIGSHGISHTPLDRLPFREAARELVESRRELEQHVGRSVRFFSFPHGRYPLPSNRDDRDNLMKLLRSYSGVCSIRWGRFNSEETANELRRIAIWDSDSFEDFKDKLNGCYDWLAVKEALGRTARSVLGALRKPGWTAKQ